MGSVQSLPSVLKYAVGTAVRKPWVGHAVLPALTAVFAISYEFFNVILREAKAHGLHDQAVAAKLPTCRSCTLLYLTCPILVVSRASQINALTHFKNALSASKLLTSAHRYPSL